MGVSERIKEFIKHTGLSVSRFEKMCGLSNGYIANIKHGIGAMKLEIIHELVDPGQDVLGLFLNVKLVVKSDPHTRFPPRIFQK